MANLTQGDRHPAQGNLSISPGLVAGFGGAAAEGRIEALAAGAALDRVWVHHGEAAAHERIDEVDLRAVEILQRERINDDLDPSLLDDLVVVGWLRLERHAVGEARASPGSDIDAQRALRHLLRLEDALQARNGFVGQTEGRHLIVQTQYTQGVFQAEAFYCPASTSQRGQLRTRKDPGPLKVCFFSKEEIPLARVPLAATGTRRIVDSQGLLLYQRRNSSG